MSLFRVFFGGNFQNVDAFVWVSFPGVVYFLQYMLATADFMCGVVEIRIVRKSGKEPNRDESYRPMLLIPRLLLKKFIETIVNQKHSRIQQVCRIITENAIKKNICSQPFFSTSPRHSISCGTKVCCINCI